MSICSLSKGTHINFEQVKTYFTAHRAKCAAHVCANTNADCNIVMNICNI